MKLSGSMILWLCVFELCFVRSELCRLCVCDSVCVAVRHILPLNLLPKLSQRRSENVHFLHVVTQWLSQVAGEAAVGSEQPAPVEDVPGAGGWNRRVFKVHSNPHHSGIL